MKASSLGLCFLLAVGATTAVAQTPAAPAPTFSIPAKQLDLMGTKYLKVSKRILLPTVNLEVMNWGKISSVTQTSALQTLGGASNSTQRSTMEVAVPSDIAALRAVATELFTDLATKLRAAGWDVIPTDDPKAGPVFAAAKHEEVDEKLGAPIRKVTLGKQKMHYTIAAPVGLPTMAQGFMMPFWDVRSLLGEMASHAVDVTYRFDPVALQGESKHGLTRNSASTSAQANLMLVHAKAFFATPKGAIGSISLKSPVAVVGGIGEIKKAADVSPELANGLSKALSLFAGGAITSKKGLYVCELDQAALTASLLLAGKAFNDEIVKGFATER